MDRRLTHPARKEHPDTSHKAARELTKTGKRAVAMRTAAKWLHHFPGRTASELESLSGLGDGKIRKRLNDLRHIGKAKKGEKRTCSVTGRIAYTWLPV